MLGAAGKAAREAIETVATAVVGQHQQALAFTGAVAEKAGGVSSALQGKQCSVS
jgi:hypothetical protein